MPAAGRAVDSQDMEYTSTSAWGVALRIYRPEHPRGDALLWVHGGGFTGGDLNMPEADWVARTLALRGHLVVTVDYRLATETVHFPAPSDDVLKGWAWLCAHAAGLGSPGATHLGGASAGGNLALGAALRIRDGDQAAHGARRPASVVLAYPTLHAVQPAPSAALAEQLSSLPAGERKPDDYVLDMYASLVGGAIESAPAAAVPGTVDPSGLPPVIIVASDIDLLRPSAEGYDELLTKHGLEHEYVVEPGTRHGHLNEPDSTAAFATIERFHAWLGAHAARRSER